jgi:hypothetical protein
MNPRGRGMRAAALGAAAALLLLSPMPFFPDGPLVRASGGAVHVALFAALAGGIGRALPPGIRGWPLWVGLAVFAGLLEGLQLVVGRSAEWSDWLFGLGGAICVCATWNRPRVVRWGAVAALGFLPLAWAVAMVQAECRAFPALAQPGTVWARRGWALNGVALSSARGSGFKLVPVPDKCAEAYPGLFREPAVGDWRGIRRFHADVYWPETTPAAFAIRVDDRPGHPPYADRFQKEFGVTQGWNAVRISAEEIAQTAGGRPLRLDTVRQWGVFLVSDVPFDYFCLGPVGLDMQEEQP